MIFRPVRFCLIYFGATILLAVLGIVGFVFFQIEPSSGGSVVVPLSAAMFEGMRFAQNYQGRPTSRAMWKAALGMTWLALLLSFLYGVLLFSVFPKEFEPLTSLPALWIAGIVFFVTLMQLLLLRMGYGLGVRNGLRGLQGTA